MKLEVQALLSAIERFNGTPVLVVGDLIVDHYVWGKVSRISPEAPVLVVNVREESRRPGGAANVAKNLLTLGAKVHLCGVVGDDEAGRELTRMLQQDGCDTSGILIDRSRPTTVKSRVIAHSQQVVRVDREESKPIDSTLSAQISAVVGAKLETVRGAIVSDYAKGVIGPSLFELLKSSRERGLTGIGKVPVLVDPKDPNFPLYHHATVVKPNRSEAAQASGVSISTVEDAFRAGAVLLDQWQSEMVLVTLGEQGMALTSRGDSAVSNFAVDTVAREVFDVSGAGDTVSAVFLLALAAGCSGPIAAQLSNFAAGIVVREVGTATVSADELRDAVERAGEE